MYARIVSIYHIIIRTISLVWNIIIAGCFVVVTPSSNERTRLCIIIIWQFARINSLLLSHLHRRRTVGLGTLMWTNNNSRIIDWRWNFDIELRMVEISCGVALLEVYIFLKFAAAHDKKKIEILFHSCFSINS